MVVEWINNYITVSFVNFIAKKRLRLATESIDGCFNIVTAEYLGTKLCRFKISRTIFQK